MFTILADQVPGRSSSNHTSGTCRRVLSKLGDVSLAEASGFWILLMPEMYLFAGYEYQRVGMHVQAVNVK